MVDSCSTSRDGYLPDIAIDEQLPFPRSSAFIEADRAAGMQSRYSLREKHGLRAGHDASLGHERRGAEME